MRTQKGAKSIIIANGTTQIAIVKEKNEVVFHQSFNGGRDTKAAAKVQTQLKAIMGTYDSKLSYEKRFSKLATVINLVGNTKTFLAMSRRLKNFVPSNN